MSALIFSISVTYLYFVIYRINAYDDISVYAEDRNGENTMLTSVEKLPVPHVPTYLANRFVLFSYSFVCCRLFTTHPASPYYIQPFDITGIHSSDLTMFVANVRVTVTMQNLSI